jgi:hypothetical protein
MFMMYFIRYSHQYVSAAITVIFRVILLQEYKGTNVVSCDAVTPQQLQIILISGKI